MPWQQERVRASDPRERAVEPQYLFRSQKALAITSTVFFGSHRWAWYGVGGDYTRILRCHLGWRLITTLHEPTPAPLLLISLNGLLLRPKSWESSLTLSFHILIQSISKSCQLYLQTLPWAPAFLIPTIAPSLISTHIDHNKLTWHPCFHLCHKGLFSSSIQRSTSSSYLSSLLSKLQWFPPHLEWLPVPLPWPTWSSLWLLFWPLFQTDSPPYQKSLCAVCEARICLEPCGCCALCPDYPSPHRHCA